jgi:hypothetical protein
VCVLESAACDLCGGLNEGIKLPHLRTIKIERFRTYIHPHALVLWQFIFIGVSLSHSFDFYMKFIFGNVF